MEYGRIIRKTRESLGLFQKDLATDNLSRNLLSNIEMGQVKLMPAKAMALFTQFIEVSWTKGLYCDIRFDDLLSDRQEYQDYLRANDLCKSLNDLIDKKEVNQDLIDQAVTFARRHEVGLLRYFLYLLSARLQATRGDQLKTCRLYFDALDYLKWKNPVRVRVLYETCLKEVTWIAYACEEFLALDRYLSVLNEMLERLKMPVKPEMLFNMALFSFRSEAFDSSLKHIDAFVASDIPFKRQVDGNILRCAILTSLGRYDEGVKGYFLLIKDLGDPEYKKQQIMCRVNIIHLIADKKLKAYKNVLCDQLAIMNQMTTKDLGDTATQISTYTNMGVGYAFLKDSLGSSKYYMRSLELCLSHEKWSDYVHVLNNSLTVFVESNLLDQYIHFLVQVKLDLLTSHLQATLYKLLLQLKDLRQDRESEELNQYIASVIT